MSALAKKVSRDVRLVFITGMTWTPDWYVSGRIIFEKAHAHVHTRYALEQEDGTRQAPKKISRASEETITEREVPE